MVDSRASNAAVPPSRKSPTRKSHVRKFSRNRVGCGYLVAVTGFICGCYGVHMNVTGSMSCTPALYRAICLAWHLRDRFTKV